MMQRRLPLLAAFVFLPLFIFLVCIPVAALFFTAHFDRATFFSAETLSLVRFTLKQASLSLLGSLIVGIPLGFFFSRDWSSRVRANLLTLYSMPTLMTAMAVLLLLRGTDFRFGLASVVIAHTFLNAPWIALVVGEGLFQFPEKLREAARVSGASPLQVFRDHEAPFLVARIVPAGLQVFSLCVMSFALVLLLGGGPPIQTLETEIFARIRMGDPDASKAGVYAIWQLLCAAFPWMIAAFVRRIRKSRFEKASLESRPVPLRSRKRRVEWLSLALLFPYLPILFGNGKSYEPQMLRAFFSEPEIWEASRTSLLLALGVGVMTSALSALAVTASIRFRWVSVLAVLPSGISALVLSLGFWFAYANFVDPFEGSRTAMILIQSVLLLPFGVRLLLPLLDEKNTRALEAAQLLGARPLRAWFDVEFPRAKGPLLSVFGIASACSLGEIAAVSLFASESVIPLPLLLSRLMSQYRFDEAGLLSGFLFVLSFVLVRLQVRR